MKNTIILTALCCCASAPVFANKLSADLNPDAFGIKADALHASNGILYSAELLLTDDSGEMAAISMRTNGQVGNNKSLSGGLGGKTYVLDDEEDTYFALSLGGHLKYVLPEHDKLIFSGALYYAPSITITDEVESVIDLNLRASYQLFENAAVYGGVRHLVSENENDREHEFDSGLHAGIEIDF